MKEQGLDLLEAAKSFAENRDKMTEKLSTVSDMGIVRQVRKILRTKIIPKFSP